jgi:competence protein ComEC
MDKKVVSCNLFWCTNSQIPVGKNNRYGHPNDNVLDNLEDSKIYRTDENGSIMFKINKDELKIKTCIL